MKAPMSPRAGGDGEFNNILVAQTAFLGDVVLTTPLFKAIKGLYPGARLTLLTTPAAKPLVEEDPYLDAILTYDKKGGESLFSALKKIRAGSFDLLLSPHRSHRTSLLGFLSGIPVRVGYEESGFSILHTRRVKRPMELHEVDRILALLSALGLEANSGDRKLAIGYTDAERAEVQEVLDANGVGPEEKLAGLCPGSAWATKRWTPEGFAAVGGALRDKGFRVVLVGGPDDREAADKVTGLLGGNAVDATGRTSLKALSAWVDRFSVFVTNDSAPLHVAAARNVPTVAVFGPTVKSLGFFPFHEKSRVAEVALACRPCGLHGGDACPLGHFRCMRDVTPEMVMEKIGELMSTGEERTLISQEAP